MSEPKESAAFVQIEESDRSQELLYTQELAKLREKERAIAQLRNDREQLWLKAAKFLLFYLSFVGLALVILFGGEPRDLMDGLVDRLSPPAPQAPPTPAVKAPDPPPEDLWPRTGTGR